MCSKHGLAMLVAAAAQTWLGSEVCTHMGRVPMRRERQPGILVGRMAEGLGFRDVVNSIPLELAVVEAQLCHECGAGFPTSPRKLPPTTCLKRGGCPGTLIGSRQATAARAEGLRRIQRICHGTAQMVSFGGEGLGLAACSEP